MMAVPVLAILLLNCGFLEVSVEGTTIQGAEAKVAALQNTNVTLHCDVTVNDDIVFMLWKKILDWEHEEALIHNNHTMNADKYQVEPSQALLIIGVDLQDEGLYQCEVNQVATRTILSVLGFGDSQSMLHVPDSWAERDTVFRCVAGVGDPSADVTAFLFLFPTGNAESYKASSVHVFLFPLLSYVLMPAIN